jgi:hypothetical protein
MTAVSALGAVAALISTAFALCTWERYRARGRLHELAWTQSLVMFALGSLAYWAAGAGGWASWNFRAFYLFGAILNVPYLALGTVYLLGGVELGRRVHRGLHVVAGFCAGVLVVAPLAHAIPGSGLPEGKHVFGVGPRVMAAVGSGVGATIIIAGALWSAWKLAVAHRRPARGAAPAISPGRLALTNVLIAAGSIVLSLGGTVFTEGDREVGFGILLVAGIAVLFAGFLVSGTGPPATTPADVAEAPAWADDFMQELWALAHAEPAPRVREPSSPPGQTREVTPST